MIKCLPSSPALLRRAALGGCAALVLAESLVTSSFARGLRPDEFFLMAGAGSDKTAAGSAGLGWNLPWQSAGLSGRFSSRMELFASQWDFSRDTGHRHAIQFGLVPYLRFRTDDGNSPWFVEVGIGPSLLDRHCRTDDRTLGSRFNFSDNVGIGRDFGASRQYSWSLRVQHTSNAGTKKPNPGLNLVFLRVSAAF